MFYIREEFTQNEEKLTSAIRVTGVSRHYEGPINGSPETPQYHSAVIGPPK